MFLKKKRCGRIKGRGCADGRPQRAYVPKEDSSSPTVSIEAVLLSSLIDAIEGRYNVVVDLPGAFMQAHMKDDVFMTFEGAMAELMVQIPPEIYRKYVTVKNGKPILYVKLQKALYGNLQAALLFWQNLSGTLQDWGFEINPYDSCVANKIINGKQCTIVWHVDDLKISHVDPAVVTEVIELLNNEFGKEGPLTINRGKCHDYLGMTLDFSTPKKVQIRMDDYIKNMLAELLPEMDGKATTPAPNHLFEVNNDNPTPLDKTQLEFLHHNVAKLLFLCKQPRPDIQTAVAFLCT